MATTDLTNWRAEFDAVVSKLPDAKLAQDIGAYATTKMRGALAIGDGAPFDLLTADYLLTTDFPEPVWAIPGILPVGLAILAGRPKVGKSWLALQIAQAVAAGGFALGQHVEAGPVLFLALEDAPRRLQERLVKQGWPPGLPAEFMPLGQFADQVGNLQNGGGEKLARQIEYRGYRLVVIDTLSRAVPGDQNDVGEMTLALTPLHEIANAHNCIVLLNDHHNKLGSADLDCVTNILGSTAKGSMADTVLGLYRERGKPGARLAVTGRDIEERTLELTWDKTTGCWQLETEARVTSKQNDLLTAVQDIGPATTSDLAEAVGRNRGNVFKQLADFEGRGLVCRDGKLWRSNEE